MICYRLDFRFSTASQILTVTQWKLGRFALKGKMCAFKVSLLSVEASVQMLPVLFLSCTLNSEKAPFLKVWKLWRIDSQLVDLMLEKVVLKTPCQTGRSKGFLGRTSLLQHIVGLTQAFCWRWLCWLSSKAWALINALGDSWNTRHNDRQLL